MIYVTLNTEAHRRLAEAVRQEFLAATPRDFSAALRYWHRGSRSLVPLNVLSALLAARGFYFELYNSQFAESLAEAV